MGAGRQAWDLPAALLEAADGEAPAAMRVTAAVAAHDKDINGLAVSPNDAFVATASQDRTAKVRTRRAASALSAHLSALQPQPQPFTVSVCCQPRLSGQKVRLFIPDNEESIEPTLGDFQILI